MKFTTWLKSGLDADANLARALLQAEARQQRLGRKADRLAGKVRGVGRASSAQLRATALDDEIDRLRAEVASRPGAADYYREATGQALEV